MYYIEDVILYSDQTFRQGRWVLARPINGPWVWRVRDAWNVLLGRAEAVQFDDQRRR